MTAVDLSSYFGLFAMLLLTGNILFGHLIATRYNPRRQWPHRKINVFKIHNWTAYIALSLVVLHPVTLLLSKTAGFRVVDVLYPFDSPKQRLYNVFGGLAFYLIVTVVVTSYFRIELGHKRWKLLHYLTYAAAALLFTHGILIDPELRNRPTDFLDGEKVWVESCCAAVIASTLWRFRQGARKRLASPAGGGPQTMPNSK